MYVLTLWQYYSEFISNVLMKNESLNSMFSLGFRKIWSIIETRLNDCDFARTWNNVKVPTRNSRQRERWGDRG